MFLAHVIRESRKIFLVWVIWKSHKRIRLVDLKKPQKNHKTSKYFLLIIDIIIYIIRNIIRNIIWQFGNLAWQRPSDPSDHKIFLAHSAPRLACAVTYILSFWEINLEKYILRNTFWEIHLRKTFEKNIWEIHFKKYILRNTFWEDVPVQTQWTWQLRGWLSETFLQQERLGYSPYSPAQKSSVKSMIMNLIRYSFTEFHIHLRRNYFFSIKLYE